ncbi:fasciclin domain-containing protein [Mucilaginibacter sp. McL0603]|uniref:fasciclin domain-containing protein n=1 Tax=Mucilaginibacter sp. McL0603 TaxID=3415670 RepID=UPI003CF971F0
MLKQAIFLILFSLSTASVFAQKSDSLVSKAGKIKNVEGAFMSSSNNIIGNISSASNFSILANAIQIAGLTDTLNSSNQVTFFAPDNKAFEKLPTGKLDTLLLPAHKTELTNLLLYHAIARKITSKDIERQIKAGNGQATFTTLSGGILTARINENRNIVLTDESDGQSVISLLDIQQSNGILFVIKTVLIPRAK